MIIGEGSGPVATKQIFKNMNASGYDEITCSKAE